jgi:hypothetical protein
MSEAERADEVSTNNNIHLNELQDSRKDRI